MSGACGANHLVALVTGGSGGIGAAVCQALASTKSLAREVARKGITVNAVSPGSVDGGMAM